MSLLKTNNLTKNYGIKETLVRALKPTSIEVEKGEFVVIVGPSGSGKSTLLHLLARLDKPSAGQVFINDKDIYSMSEKEISRYRRRNIGFIFQAFNLIPILSAEENIKLPVLMDNKKVDEAYISELMEILDIKERKNHLPGELSGGQQQRVSIARAIVNSPSLLIADEPTGNLDPETSLEIMDILSDISRAGTTIVMATHARDIVDSMKKRVIAIEKGVIARDEERGKYGYEI